MLRGRTPSQCRPNCPTCRRRPRVGPTRSAARGARRPGTRRAPSASRARLPHCRDAASSRDSCGQRLTNLRRRRACRGAMASRTRAMSRRSGPSARHPPCPVPGTAGCIASRRRCRDAGRLPQARSRRRRPACARGYTQTQERCWHCYAPRREHLRRSALRGRRSSVATHAGGRNLPMTRATCR